MQPKNQEVVEMDITDITGVLEETEIVIRQCFKQYKTEEVFLSFNGGKDCTVLLDITLNVLRDMFKRKDIGKSLKVVYIRTNDPFREIETFVKDVEKHYGVQLMVTDGELRATLQSLLEEDGRLKACLMGTRRTDPYSADLNFMQKTDPSWPQIVRVSPLLNWSYHQIWSYILQRMVPYCSLYDEGYTSIGSTSNTWPNPALAYKDLYGCLSYHPAWRLSDASLERAGRGSQSHTNGHADMANRHPNMANECSDMANRHTNIANECSDMANGHTNLANESSDMANVRANMDNELSDMANGHVDIANRNTDMANRHNVEHHTTCIKSDVL